MGRIQVVLSDETENKFRDKLAEIGKTKKGSISDEIERIILSKLSTTDDDKFLTQEDVKIDKETLAEASDFYENIETLEKKMGQRLILFYDKKTEAIYTVCHVSGDILTKLMDLDVPIDPEFQAEFRANRNFQPDDPTYKKMVEDGKRGRQFSDIVIEYDKKHENPKNPLKILGGQHRSKAIEASLPTNRYHGIRVYFNLNKEKRTELYIVSNTNIDIPADLLDRLEEQGLVPPNVLREFAWEIGLLKAGEDFSERKSTEEDSIPVRTLRTFIVNYFEGLTCKKDFDNDPIVPELCRAGISDDSASKYLKLYNDIRESKMKPFKEQTDLLKAGKEFVKLHKKQYQTIEAMKDIKGKAESRTKALTPSVISAWAFTAGALQTKKERLQKLYDLPTKSKDEDPLNVAVLRTSKLEDIDGPMYRGLGTRSGPNERGKMLKLFLLYSESKKDRIDKDMTMAAIHTFVAAQAQEEKEKARKKAL